MNLRRFLAIASLALSLSPGMARAQATDFDRATARTLGQEGHAALDQKDYATAADRFTRADALVHAPTFQLGLAQSEVGLGKLVSALERYNRILREGLPAKPPDAWVKALDQARKEFDALAPRIPSVTVRVSGAATPRVTIDGVGVPPAALGVRRAVDPGKRVIRASADAEGLTPVEVTLTIGEGKAENLTLELKPPGVPASPPQITPAAPPAEPQPEAKPEVKPVAGPLLHPKTHRLLGVIGLAVGGAGLGVGAVMGGLVIAKHASILGQCPRGHCPEGSRAQIQPELDTYHALSAGSTAGFVVGGVLAGAGVVLLVTAPRDVPPTASGAIVPVLGLGWSGVEGRF